METEPITHGAKGEALTDALLSPVAGASSEPETGEALQTEKPTQPQKPAAGDRAVDPLEDALAAILEDETPQDEKPSGEAGEPEKPAEAPATDLTLALVAEKLGVDMKTLFDVPIPMPDEGEPCSLGQLKDQAVRWRRSEADRLEWDADHEHQLSGLATARDEIATLVALIPEQYRTPAMLERARADLTNLRGQEAQKTLDRIPEWADISQYKVDQELMAEHADKFGFTAQELKGVIDSRLVAYIRHNARREKRIIEAGERARGKRVSNHPTRTPGAGRKPAKSQPATLHSTERERKDAALTQVLANQ